MQRPQFESVRAYGNCFTDPVFWRSYIEEVCRRHGLDCTTGIRSALPGTHPVFLVGEQWVIKLFSDLFHGAHSFAAERDVYRLIEQTNSVPTPKLVGEGRLFSSTDEGWDWPYLVSTQLPGTSLGEVYDQIDLAQRTEIAQYLGETLRRLHSVPLAMADVLRPDWAPFRNWLLGQRRECSANHRRWQSLPERLIDQIDTYLPDIDTLLDRSAPPLLLHCDMNADHLIGSLNAGRWISSGIIDFGDAKVGDLLYELAALHLGLFRDAPTLLHSFLRAYGSAADMLPDFAFRAMCFTLLHECNVLESLPASLLADAKVTTLPQLAAQIWR